MSQTNANEPDSERDISSSPQFIGYARVSTDDQRLDLQLDALRRAGCETIYEEKISAARRTRSELELALKSLQPGDTFVVWRLDRLARSMRDLLKRLEQIEEAGAKFRSLTEHFDTRTAGGRFLLYILGAVAEFERQLTVERTSAGMRALRDRGHKLGAKLKFTEPKRAKAKAMLKATRTVVRGGKTLMRPKYTRRAIAKKLGVSYQTLYDWIKRGYK
jgi:DNA invertase Pin-like site-specific DNA recombinase